MLAMMCQFSRVVVWMVMCVQIWIIYQFGLLMGGKDKKAKEQVEECPDDCSEDCCDGEEEEIDIEEEVEKKIKALPTLAEKVQAIAVNGYLIEKRRLDKQLEGEIEAIERNFRERFAPLTGEINNIVSGQHGFSDADFQEIGELLTAQQQENKHNYFTNERIPEFWLKVFTNSDVLGEQVEERDEPLLKHLLRVEAGKSEDLKTLWVDFYFSENQWFTNAKLHKEFELEGEVIKKSSGDQIAWKEGKNITIKIVKKKNKKKGGEKKTKEVKEKSFFNFFLDVEIDSEEDEDEENPDDGEDVQELENQYEIAQTIYEDLVPKSLEYYLGVIETIGDYGDLDDIEEEDEEDDEPPAKKKNKLKAQ